MTVPRGELAGSVTKALLLVDDHPILRRGLTALIESEPGLTVLAAVARATSVGARLIRTR